MISSGSIINILLPQRLKTNVKALHLIFASLLFLSICITLYFFSYSSALVFSLESLAKYSTLPGENDCKIVFRNFPSHGKYERPETKNYFFSSESEIISIPWNFNTSKSVDIQNVWIYNPSVVNVDSSAFFFSATILWTCGLDCGHIQYGSPDLIFACLKSNYWKVTDGSTLFGFFDMNSCTANIIPGQAYSGWNHGDSWGDTKLLFSMGTNANPSIQTGKYWSRGTTSRPTVLMTSLNTEYICSGEWEGTNEKSFLIVSMLHMLVVDLEEKSVSHVRSVFYDPVEDDVRLKNRQLPNTGNDEYDLFTHSIDYGRELCAQRPAQLPQFPHYNREYTVGNIHTRMWFKKDLYAKRGRRKEAMQKKSVGVEVEHLNPWTSRHR